MLPVAIFLAPSAAFGGWFFVSSLQGKKAIRGSLDSKQGDIFRIWNYDIIEATGDFDMGHCIGTGGCGSVYRAELPNGRVVALKKSERQNPAFDKCFRKQGQILICDYMERGCLFCLLRDDDEAVVPARHIYASKNQLCAL